jgi:general secretion pathway protein L
MQSISSDAHFFGVDLKALWQEIRQSWQRSTQKTLFAWLTPAAPVVLLHADGTQSYWLGDKCQPSDSKAVKNAFVAVELPPENVLLRSFSVPLIGDADIADAIALEARTSSPFAEHDMVWGHQVRSQQDGARNVELVIASRKQIAAYLATQSARLSDGATPEVWVLAPLVSPIVLRGFGEGLRDAFAKKRRRIGYALLLLAFALMAAIAITPTAQLRLRALEAVLAYDNAVQRTASAAQQREAFMLSVEKLGGLSQMLVGRIEPLRVLDKLTTVLPDDTALQSFKLQGAKVTIAGDTANASTLLQILGAQPGLKDVRAPAAATRMLGAPKESFVIEFVLDPQVFGVMVAPPSAILAPAATPDGANGGAASPPASAPVSAPMEGVRPPATPGSTPAAPVATFGGRATFGGTMPKPPEAPGTAASPSKIKP